MADLTLEEVINIHNRIQKRFNISRGIKNIGLLESIIERPSFNPFTHVPFPNVHAKCASLLEGIIKWHPFIDGNKRTALATAYAFMHKNDYRIVLPFSAVRFSVLVAQDKKDIDEITKWVRRLSAKGDMAFNHKFIQYLVKPARRLLHLYNTGQNEKAEAILGDWLAFDIYPEYKSERLETVQFLMDIAKRGSYKKSVE